MCFTAKASMTGFLLITIVALFLFYRGEKYDRVLSLFIIALGLIQVIEYGIHMGINSQTAGLLLFVTLWLQTLVFAIGLYIFMKEGTLKVISTWYLVIYSIIFIIALIYAVMNKNSFTGQEGSSGHIEWTRNGGGFLGDYWWVYLLGIFIPLLLLLSYYQWKDIGLYFLILYGIISLIYVRYTYPPEAFSSMWCYLVVGFAFLAWFIGITHQCTSN